MKRHTKRFHILLSGLLLASAPALASDTTIDETERLHGYGWSLYQGLYTEHATGAAANPAPGSSRAGNVAIQPAGPFSPRSEGLALWREPGHGLFDTIGAYLDRDQRGVYQRGAGGEWYHGALTAMGKAGYLEDSFDRHSFAGIDLRWYARDNISLQIGWEQLNNNSLGNLRFEYAPRINLLSGLSFFAGASGEGVENPYFIGGLRYTFGASPSLIERDRLDPSAARDSLSPYFRSLWLDP